MTENNKEFERFKEEFDEIIMLVDARLDIVEKQLKDLNKLLREVQTGIRQVDQKTLTDWNGLRGTVGDLQKKISEITKPIRGIKRNGGGYQQ